VIRLAREEREVPEHIILFIPNILCVTWMYNTYYRFGSGRGGGGGPTTAIGYHVQTKRNSSRPSCVYIYIYIGTYTYTYITYRLRAPRGNPVTYCYIAATVSASPLSRTHAHKIYNNIWIFFFFRILFLFLSFHFSARSIEFALPTHTVARARSPTRSVSVHSATGTTAPPTHRDICQLKSRRRSSTNSVARAVRVNSCDNNISLLFCRVFRPAGLDHLYTRRKYIQYNYIFFKKFFFSSFDNNINYYIIFYDFVIHRSLCNHIVIGIVV